MNHGFIENLKNLPIEIDNWALKEVGLDNEGPFKKNYQSLKVRETNELLVDISQLGIISFDHYFDKFLKGDAAYSEAVKKKIIHPHAYLRKSHAERLAKVDAKIKEAGLFLVIVSGWRHPEIQEIAKKEYTKKNGAEKAERMYASSVGWSVPAPHTTGAAFDIEIWSAKTGKKLSMKISVGSEFVYGLYKGEILASKRPSIFESNSLKEALGNRRLLYHLLCTKNVIFDREEELFVGHPGEFWHYGDGDTLSAYLRKEKYIRYGLIYPEKNN
jgi:D-alanyl-D-alanine dipeptidase